MQNTIQLKDLLLELKCAIEDLFIAQIVERQQEIELHFLNGQKFVVKIEEV